MNPSKPIAAPRAHADRSYVPWRYSCEFDKRPERLPPNENILTLFVSISSCGYLAPPGCWKEQSTTPEWDAEAQTFQVTHCFHPQYGKRFEIVTCHNNWGEARVFYHNEPGKLCSLPLRWTSLAPVDLFVQISAGRAAFQITDLLELSRLLKALDREEPNET